MPDYKRLIILNLPYLIFWYLADKISWLYRMMEGEQFAIKLYNTFLNFNQAFENLLPSFHPVDILIGVIAMVIIRLIIYFKGKNAKKFRQGEEYGSARWV